MSEFTELREISPKDEVIDVNTDAKDFDDPNEVPLEERWSWNPMDWYTGTIKEFQQASFEMTEKTRVLIRAIAGEGLVTFLFMFIVEAVAINNMRRSTPDNLSLSVITTAFSAVALIYSFADVSGAHFNPAVTFATMVTGKVSVRKGLAFIGIQLFASVFATLFLMAVFPGVTNPITGLIDVGSIPGALVLDAGDIPIANAFFMEFILTFILIYVIFATAFDTVDSTGKNVKVKDGSAGANLTIYTTSGNTKAGFAPVAIGFTLGFLGAVGGSVSGGAFNPARAFGPTLLSGQGWTNHWIFWIADLSGAALAGTVQHFFAHEATQHSAAIKTKAQATRDQTKAIA